MKEFSRIKPKPTDRQFSALNRGIFPAASSFLLENPFRRLIKSPQTVLKRLHLFSNSRVIEIGAGSGYYSREVVKQLSSGNLTLLDIQAEMLELNLNSIPTDFRDKVNVIIADAADLPLSSNAFDIAYMVTTLGEVNRKENCLHEVFRVLKEGGLLSISEQRTDPDFLSRATVINIATQAGFKHESNFGWFWNYTLNFRK